MTQRTLYLLVTCCVEQTRFEVLKQVVQNLKDEQATKGFNIEKDLLVFDNGSTHPGTIELLTKNFAHVRRSETNEGFWSAINWAIQTAKVGFDYIYVIESDHIHFALEKLKDIEEFLDTHPHIGGVRAQEFVVAERHLYDKSSPQPGSRPYAWVRQVNLFTGKKIEIVPTDVPGFYDTDFLSQLHSVNRLEPLRQVFNQLEKQSCEGKRFSELDYQLLYNKLYPRFGIIDGGLFHAKLTWGTGALAGSFVATGTADRSYNGPMLSEANGYQETRVSIITPPEKMHVKML